MMSGYYSAASGILVQQRNINVIASNISNSQTPGYRLRRTETTTYDHDFMVRLEEGNNSHIGAGSPAALVDIVETEFDQSSLKETESPFDMAIVGDGYFNIQGNAYQFLTRNGNFNIDADGYLVLAEVGRVLGQNGEIQVGGSDFSVNADGSVADAQGNIIDTLLITMPADDSDMVKFENGFFITDNAIQTNSTVRQYTLERSNMDLNMEYTRLIEAQRALQACATGLSTIDSINAKAATLSSVS